MTSFDCADDAANAADTTGLGALMDKAQPPTKSHWFDDLQAGSSGFELGLRAKATQPQPSAAPLAPEPAPDSVAQKEAEAAIKAAFEEGMEAGLAAAKESQSANDRAARALRLRFGELDKAALDAMESALAKTVLKLCDGLFGEIAQDRDRLNERCRIAAAQLGQAASGCALHLHPQDVALLASDLSESWRIVEDDTLERGSLLFESGDGSVSDGPADWRAVIAEAIGVSGVSKPV